MTRRVSFAALIAVLLAVGVRLALPDGWMLDPARGAGAPLVLCPDAAPVPATPRTAAHGRHAEHHAGAPADGGAHGGVAANDEEHADGASPVCPFAAAALAATLDPPALFAAPARFAASAELRTVRRAAPAAAAPRRGFQARAPPESGRA